MILSCQDVAMEFAGETLFSGVSFFVEEHEKVALVGPNGCGKSTLLKIIISELSPTEGSVIVQKQSSVGYLAQYQEDGADEDIYTRVLTANPSLLDMEQSLSDMETSLGGLEGNALEAQLEKYHQLRHRFDVLDGPSYRSEVAGALKGLGFSEEEFSKKFLELSGGQKTRVNLARLLMQKPDLLLLDEPINHLDLRSIEWLETYLSNYKGALVLVAHDRYFLDKIAEKVVDMDFHTAHSYKGNYSAYVEQKREILLTREREYEKQQKEIAHQEAVIEKLKSYNRQKSVRRANSRIRRLEKMQPIERLVSNDVKIGLSIEPESVSGKDVLEVSHLEKSFDGRRLFSDLSFSIQRGEHVALIGDNGTGKTTILKVINQLYAPDSGEYVLGAGVTISYYDQEQQQLNEEKTLFDELLDSYPHLTDTKVRNVLAAFLFRQDDAFKKISALSGGERGRISLAKMMLSGANFLILDEPTNHLDMDSKDILEDAINSYTGTVLYVSHDRYFINQTADRILELGPEGLTNYLGDYDYYISKRQEISPRCGGNMEASLAQSKSHSTDAKASWEEQKRQAAIQRKRESDIKKLEDEIGCLEDEIGEIDAQFLLDEVAKNSAKLNDLTQRQGSLKAQLETAYERWEELFEEV